MSDSLILNKLIETTTSESAIEFLKKQQEQLQRQLEQQELLNQNLYKSLLDSGLLRQATTSTVANLYDSFRQNHYTFNPNQYSPPTTLSSLINHNLNYNNGLVGGGLNSLLPFNEMFNGMGSVIEKLFGGKFWIYGIIAIFISIIFVFFACFCIYCCCCSRLGRTLMCCMKLPSISKSSSKKKEAEGNKKCCF